MGVIEDLRKITQNGYYFNPEHVLSYHRPYIFLPGRRGGGKSTNIAAFCILDYIYNGHMFLYVRRDWDECQLTCRGFFSNACDIINDVLGINVEVYYRAKYFYIKDKDKMTEDKCGAIIPLKLEGKRKSGVDMLPKVWNIIYDEFIADKLKGQHYLGTAAVPDMEPRLMHDLYLTVDRDIGRPRRNETRVFFLGNAEEYAGNPFFLTYGVADELERNPHANTIAPKQTNGHPCMWVMEKVHPAATTEGAETSWGYYLAPDEREIEYAFGEAGTDDTRFVMKKPECRMTPMCNVVIRGKPYIIESSESRERMHARKGRNTYIRTISCDLLGHDGKIDFQLVRAWKNIPELVCVELAFNTGTMTFDSIQTKNAFMRYLKYLPA